MKYVVIIIYLLRMSLEEESVSSVMIADYSDVAAEAVLHKRDILSFLNETRIRIRYKALFNVLLSKLVGSTRRIVSGMNTSISAVPWQASLRDKDYPICGASIVTDKWLLTAAHCLLKARPTDLSVRLGSSWKTHGGEIYDVKEIIIHPKYSGKIKTNDVGLIKLHSTLRFSAQILPIRLIAKNVRLKADELAIVSGWGKLKEGGPGTSFLQSTAIRTINMKRCRQSGLDGKAIDPASMFCAGYFHQPFSDACQGDSGGPLVNDGVLIGVVSWGLGCARGSFPGVYTRLSFDVIWDWIHDHIIEIDGKPKIQNKPSY